MWKRLGLFLHPQQLSSSAPRSERARMQRRARIQERQTISSGHGAGWGYQERPRMQRRATAGAGILSGCPAGTGAGIMPSPEPARVQARRGSVAEVSSLSMAHRDDLGGNVKFGRIGKSATYTFLTYLDGQCALDTYQGKNRNLLVF